MRDVSIVATWPCISAPGLSLKRLWPLCTLDGPSSYINVHLYQRAMEMEMGMGMGIKRSPNETAFGAKLPAEEWLRSGLV